MKNHLHRSNQPNLMYWFAFGALCLTHLPLNSQSTIFGYSALSSGLISRGMKIDVLSGEITEMNEVGFGELTDFGFTWDIAEDDHPGAGLYDQINESYGLTYVIHDVSLNNSCIGSDRDVWLSWSTSDGIAQEVEEIGCRGFYWARYSSQDLETGDFYSLHRGAFSFQDSSTIIRSSAAAPLDFTPLTDAGDLEPINPDAFDSANKEYVLMKEYEVDDTEHRTIIRYNVETETFTDSIEIGACDLARLSTVYSLELNQYWGVKRSFDGFEFSESWVAIDTSGAVTELAALPDQPDSWMLTQNVVLDQTNLIATLTYYNNYSVSTRLVAIDAVTGAVLASNQYPYRLRGIKPNNQQYAEDNFFLLEPNQKPTEPLVNKATKTNGTLVAYPNPANETCRVSVQVPSIIRVFDAFGREVWNSVQPINSEVIIPVGQWPAGLYVIKGHGGAQARIVVSE